MEAADIEEMGPIDYVLIEWADSEPTGEAVPIVLDLVDRGIIRVLDFALFAKNEDGDVAAIDFGEMPEHAAALEEFRGASSGVLSDEDLAEAAAAISPGALAGLIVYENSWAGPFAAAVRRSGGQLVASDRIHVQAFLAALDAAEAAGRATRQKGPTDARIAQRGGEDRGRRRHRNRRQQPRLEATGGALGPAGTAPAVRRARPGPGCSRGPGRRSDRPAQGARRAA